MNAEDADEISQHFAHGEILDKEISSNGQEIGDHGKNSTGNFNVYLAYPLPFLKKHSIQL